MVQAVITDSPQPLSNYSVEELVEATQRFSRTRAQRQADMDMVYIAANLTEIELRNNNFIVGDGTSTDDVYTNYAFEPGVKYNIGARGVVNGADTPLYMDSPLPPPSSESSVCVYATHTCVCVH